MNEDERMWQQEKRIRVLVVCAGETSGYIGLISDITALHQYYRQHYPGHDALTALPGITWFMEQLQARMDIADRHREKVAVAYIDLDEFKAINATHGPQAGNEVIAEIADRLRNVRRKRPARPSGQAWSNQILEPQRNGSSSSIRL